MPVLKVNTTILVVDYGLVAHRACKLN